MQPYGIMFHHFRGGGHVRGQGSLSAEELAEMILWLGPERILSAREWQCRAEEGTLDIEDLCLTFDDNLRCQYDVALPVLREFDLTAFWFVPTATLEGQPNRLEVYRQFRSRAFEQVDDFYEAFFRALAQSDTAEEVEVALGSFAPGSYLVEYPFYTEADRRFRFVRDHVLGPDRYQNLMDTTIASMGYGLAELARGLWMDSEQLHSLHESGHVLGLHSHTHPTRMALLYPEAQLREYRANQAALERITDRRPVCMSHPCNSYDGSTIAILRRLGVTLGFRANTALAEFSELEYPREDHANVLAEMRTCGSPSSPATSLATLH